MRNGSKAVESAVEEVDHLDADGVPKILKPMMLGLIEGRRARQRARRFSGGGGHSVMKRSKSSEKLVVGGVLRGNLPERHEHKVKTNAEFDIGARVQKAVDGSEWNPPHSF